MECTQKGKKTAHLLKFLPGGTLAGDLEADAKGGPRTFTMTIGDQTLSSGAVVQNDETLACTADMQDLCRERPWLTLLDLEIYAEAWRRGARFHAPARM